MTDVPFYVKIKILSLTERQVKILYYQHENANIPGHHDIRYYENFTVSRHMHHDFELICLLSGSAELSVDDRTEIMHAPAFALVLCNQLHAIRSLDEVSSAIIHVFSGDVVSSFSQRIAGFAGADAVFDCPRAVRNFYLDTIASRRDFGSYTLKGCLYLILEQYLAYAALHERKSRQTTLLSAIFAYIGAHYTERITLEDVAKECGYQPHYLSRVFSDAVGINFKRFINSYRLDHARTLLQETDMSVTEVAMASGFGSVRSFNRAFAEEYHEPPKKRVSADLICDTTHFLIYESTGTVPEEIIT